MQLKDVSVSTIPGALSALEVLCDYITLHNGVTDNVDNYPHFRRRLLSSTAQGI